jgi:hypothetical protein
MLSCLNEQVGSPNSGNYFRAKNFCERYAIRATYHILFGGLFVGGVLYVSLSEQSGNGGLDVQRGLATSSSLNYSLAILSVNLV